MIDNYSDARAAFLAAARERSAQITEHVFDGAKGAQGETLAMDVAVVGDRAAPKALLVVSGAHGLEGLPGSAAQREFLLKGPVVRGGLKLVLVHALNPWGVSHRTRGNEDNVDVNRNFVDFKSPYTHNTAFDAMYPALCPDDWTDDVLERSSEMTSKILKEHGAHFVLNGATAGQRHEPKGTNYGGLEPSWTRKTIEMVVDDNLANCEKVAFIDWHTGFGDYARLFHLCDHEKGSEALDQVASWWGSEAVTSNASAFQGADGEVPKWQGMFSMKLPSMLPKALVAGSVIEFGTFPNNAVRASIMIDRFFRFGRANLSSKSHEELRGLMIRGFFPKDSAWQKEILAQSLAAHCKALEGLAAW